MEIVPDTISVTYLALGDSYTVGEGIDESARWPVQLARGLGVESYGYYGIAFSVITLCGIPGEMGLTRLVTREIAAASVRNDYPRLFGVLRWADLTAFRISLPTAVAVMTGGIILSQTRPSGHEGPPFAAQRLPGGRRAR